MPRGHLSAGRAAGLRRSGSLGAARAAQGLSGFPQSSRDSPKVTKRVRKKQSVPGSGPNKQNPIKKKKMTLGILTKKPGYQSTLHSCRLIFLKCKWDAPRSNAVPFRGPGAPGERLSPRRPRARWSAAQPHLDATASPYPPPPPPHCLHPRHTGLLEFSVSLSLSLPWSHPETHLLMQQRFLSIAFLPGPGLNSKDAWGTDGHSLVPSELPESWGDRN